MTDFTRDELCAVAVAETFRGDGEIMISPMSTVAKVGACLAKLTFEPDLVLTDGIASIQQNVLPIGSKDEKVVEGWMPYRSVFDMLWWGKRHVMMGATQIDKFGNQNIACIGPWEKPKAQLLGVRGAPGNTINHTTSYFVGNHTDRVFVEKVDVVCGVGYDNAAKLNPASTKHHEIRRVISNLGVMDFGSPDKRMRLVSVHPGVTVDDVKANTGFELVIPESVPETAAPTAEQLEIIRTKIDPNGYAKREVKV